MLKIRGCRIPKLTRNLCIFDYFSTTTAQNCLRFSAFATLRSLLTGNRQAKPGRFQTRSLTKFLDCTFYTLGTVLEIRVFVNNPMFFGSLVFRLVLLVELGHVITLFRGLG